MAQTPEPDTSAAVADTTAAVSDGATETSTADVAARRRRGKAAKVPADQATVIGAAPVDVEGATPVAVIASRTLVSEHHGAGGPARPGVGGPGGVWMGKPLVLNVAPGTPPQIAPGIDNGNGYTIAACDASEQFVPPGCVTPTSRLLWKAGMLVRTDLYTAVLAEHAARAAEGVAGIAQPAALPTGITDPPADAIALTPAAAATEPIPAPSVAEVRAPAVLPT